jgi:hypothetical protein
MVRLAYCSRKAGGLQLFMISLGEVRGRGKLAVTPVLRRTLHVQRYIVLQLRRDRIGQGLHGPLPGNPVCAPATMVDEYLSLYSIMKKV